MDITTKAELFQVIADLQGQVVNLQETVDKLSPVKEEEPVEPEETKEELSEEEVSEIDQLLQES